MVLNLIRTYLETPDLHFEISEDWNAANKTQIREAITRAWYRAEFPQDHLNIQASPPHSETHTITLTHSRNAGGFAWVRKPKSIGIDIEDIHRISDRIIHRVSSETEITACPMPPWLWSAKEAAYKAFSYTEDQVNMLSQVLISNWERIGPDSLSYDARTEDEGYARGMMLLQQGRTIAVCVRKEK